MRDSQNSIESFMVQVEEKIKNMVTLSDMDLRRGVIDSSTFPAGRFFFNLRNLGKTDFIRLALYSHYAPEEVSSLLKLDLEEKLKDFDLETQVALNALLGNKVKMQLFLIQTQLWHSREFFGNIVGKNVNLNRFLKFRRTQKKEKIIFPQRKRGYDDHGSRRPSHKWKPDFDISLTLKQNELERERESLNDTLSLIEGMLY